MMKARIFWLAIPVAVLISLTVIGCGTETELTVKAPPGVDVKSASIGSGGTLKCSFTSNKSGELRFSLSYKKTMTPENNPAILSGEVELNETVSFTKDVEANKNYDISQQFDNLKGDDISYGTFEINLNSTSRGQT